MLWRMNNPDEIDETFHTDHVEGDHKRVQAQAGASQNTNNMVANESQKKSEKTVTEHLGSTLGGFESTSRDPAVPPSLLDLSGETPLPGGIPLNAFLVGASPPDELKEATPPLSDEEWPELLDDSIARASTLNAEQERREFMLQAMMETPSIHGGTSIPSAKTRNDEGWAASAFETAINDAQLLEVIRALDGTTSPREMKSLCSSRGEENVIPASEPLIEIFDSENNLVRASSPESKTSGRPILPTATVREIIPRVDRTNVLLDLPRPIDLFPVRLNENLRYAGSNLVGPLPNGVTLASSLKNAELSTITLRIPSRKNDSTSKREFSKRVLLCTIVKRKETSVRNKSQYKMVRKLISKLQRAISVRDDMTDWHFNAICQHAMEYINTGFSCYTFWLALGSPTGGEVLGALCSGPPRFSESNPLSEYAYGAFVFLLFYQAVKTAKQHNVEMKWDERRVVEFYLRDLYRFGQLTGDLVNGVSVATEHDPLWRLPALMEETRTRHTTQ